HPVDVACWIVLDDVGADDVRVDPVKHGEQVARLQSARLVVRNPWRAGRIERVEINADVKRRLRDRHPLGGEVAHLDDLDGEPLRLLTAVAVEGPDADLDQSSGD